MAARPILVAATRQHVGKTTLSLALMSGLRKRFGDRVGFIKPVGQEHVRPAGEAFSVDKDVELMRMYFGLDHVGFEDMSPVLIPRSYTKRFIDGEVTLAAQEAGLRASFARVRAASDAVLLEGTGHVGVGAIVGLSNARVAALLGADVVLVANGGLGKAFDELELNRALCEASGVRVRGVVLNKVLPDKVAMVRDYFGRTLAQRDAWRAVPLLGVVPDLPLLAKPSLGALAHAAGGELVAGARLRALHYASEDIEVVTTGVRRYLRKLQYASDRGRERPIYITHVTRDDIALGFLAHFQKARHASGVAGAPAGAPAGDVGDPRAYSDWAAAMILCTGTGVAGASEDDQQPLPYLIQMAQACGAPFIVTPRGTLDVMDAVKHFTAKHNVHDPARVAAAIDHYEPHICFDRLLGPSP